MSFTSIELGLLESFNDEFFNFRSTTDLNGCSQDLSVLVAVDSRCWIINSVITNHKISFDYIFNWRESTEGTKRRTSFGVLIWSLECLRIREAVARVPVWEPPELRPLSHIEKFSCNRSLFTLRRKKLARAKRLTKKVCAHKQKMKFRFSFRLFRGFKNSWSRLAGWKIGTINSFYKRKLKHGRFATIQFDMLLLSYSKYFVT